VCGFVSFGVLLFVFLCALIVKLSSPEICSLVSLAHTDSTRVTRDKEHSSRRNKNSTWNKVALASLFVSVLNDSDSFLT